MRFDDIPDKPFGVLAPIDKNVFEIMWAWLNANSGVLALLLVLLPLCWSVYTHLSIKKQDLKERRFDAYHKLIQQLVERERNDMPLRIDRQIAVVFELRNFKEYFPVSLRILKGLKEDWKDYGPESKRTRLHDELDLTIQLMEAKRSKCFWQ
ncbi:hypothetical protein [Pseudomonas sp. S9]|uniref:hypothetical protein n=1 Tax=Pseudomonas sp. S9 TaxID=686578 RepID=UPI0002556856|nr:hypothetical protein [Pseudomonas sp. S9]